MAHEIGRLAEAEFAGHGECNGKHRTSRLGERVVDAGARLAMSGQIDANDGPMFTEAGGGIVPEGAILGYAVHEHSDGPAIGDVERNRVGVGAVDDSSRWGHQPFSLSVMRQVRVFWWLVSHWPTMSPTESTVHMSSIDPLSAWVHSW